MRTAMILALAIGASSAGAAPPSAGVDAILAAAWERAGIQPASTCTDDEFLRRVQLDLIGRIPTLEEVRGFRLAPDRVALVERLLASEAFPRFWSEVWTATLVGYSQAFGADREMLRLWLQHAFGENLPYDELVRRLIAAEGAAATDGATNFLIRHREDPAVKVTQLFLGVRLDCARCHDHPFDRWKQDDYRDMARFFASTQVRQATANQYTLTSLVPGDGAQQPRFLTGAAPQTTRWREELALFTVRSKPFARAYANRLWYYFLGRGIVDPPDDFSGRDSAAVPELLETLADAARADRFDVRQMVRRICNSRAYQLASRATSESRVAGPEGNGEEVERLAALRPLFAARHLKPLLPEQWYASACVALDVPVDERNRRLFLGAAVGQALDADFSRTWEPQESAQSLLQQLARRPSTPEATLDEMFLRLLTRDPTPRERELCSGRPMEEIVFALLHGNEFAFNR